MDDGVSVLTSSYRVNHVRWNVELWLFSCPVMSGPPQPHELKHTWPPYRSVVNNTLIVYLKVAKKINL